MARRKLRGEGMVTWFCAGRCSWTTPGSRFGMRPLCDVCANPMIYAGDPKAEKYRTEAKQHNEATDRRIAANEEAKRAVFATDGPPFAGRDFAVWHLTPHGWEAGSQGMREGPVIDRPHPVDRVQTVRSMTFYDGRSPATVVVELWRTHDAAGAQLIGKFGDSPAGELWPAHQPFPVPPTQQPGSASRPENR